ncbi:hypothetical protein ACFXDH_48425 [Streptomyces sp. NPDC059467]|uniref:hypothetical protein n=1 Tax=Streptomyces sp. NPDC059467 TaxID=3346844 RepID=UPI00368FA73D
MGDVSRRRLILLDAAAALGFALLPQLTPVRPDIGAAPDAVTVAVLSLATALRPGPGPMCPAAPVARLVV